jgi:beta-1,4-mannosyl-glycoprotein beta-1,4-N-acetylglucosaminyltransferase
MIYDCFTFFNELELLEVRFHELYEAVDAFVLVEATETFQGRPKPLYFQDYKSDFKRYADKIRHIVIEFPEVHELRAQLSVRPKDTNWAREFYQRDQIARGLTGALPDDLIIVSDVDEIIAAPKLREAVAKRRPHDLTIFTMPLYTGAVNRRVRDELWVQGPRMIEFSDFPGAERLRKTKFAASHKLEDTLLGRIFTRYQNARRGVSNRIYEVADSGWHMTSIGDWDSYRSKLLAYSHTERIEWDIFKKEDAFQKMLAETTTIVDSSELPRFIQENANRFLLADESEQVQSPSRAEKIATPETASGAPADRSGPHGDVTTM